ncbi:MAG: response regulator transcription factor [Burkholderiales bacterium]|nr:response regulator transcription factor [Burkholderiales bacterium]
MNVLLIDDHEIVWNGTHRLLERLAREIEPDAPFSFHAVRDVASACALPAQGVDLVLLDYHLPDLSGLAALRAVKAHFEATPVCMQSAETSSQRVREVIEAGAAGFVPKSYRLEEIEAALRVVLRHRIYLPAEFLLSHEVTRGADAEGDSALARDELPQFLRSELSPRQRQVLALAVRGVPVKLISRQLGIAEGTVKVHLSMVYRAMGARNRTDALCRVFEAQAAAALEAP